MNQSNVRFPLLDHSRYLKAQENAAQAIKASIPAPDLATFKHTAVRIYPVWFTSAVIVALGAVLLFSFTISAGKQVAANSMIFDQLPGKFNHLSELWASMSIAFMLLLSELGSILFLVASGTIGYSAPSWKGIKITVWIFRSFAGLCAAYAIVANISVTLIDPVHAVSVLQWLISVGVPTTVLGLGALLERLVIDALRADGERKAAFEQAQRDYLALVSHPETHPGYKAVFADELWRELTRLKAQRDIVEPLVQSDPRFRRWIITTEYRAQVESNEFSFEGDNENPFLPGAVESPQLSPGWTN